MNTDYLKNILKASINSAIGIDDEYIEPYSTTSSTEEVEVSSQLYQAFHRDLNCTLSLFRYEGYDVFQSRALPLLKDKDLLLLDWQLRGEGRDAIEDVVKIIDLAVSQDSPIRFIVIYTAVENLYSLSLDLYAAFSEKNESISDEIEKIKEYIDGVLTKNHEDIDCDFIEKLVNDNLSRCILPRNRLAAKQTINRLICERLSDESKKALRHYSGRLDQLLVDLELFRCSETIGSIHCSSHRTRVLEEDVLLVENTAIFLVTKQGLGKHGYGPNQLVEHLCNKLTSLNNWRSLLLSLKLKDLLYHEMAVVGKGLGGFDDSILMNYIKPDGEKATVEPISTCFNAQIGDVLSQLDNDFVTELWDGEESRPDNAPKELARLNSFLSFSSYQKGKDHRINTGDVFIAEGHHFSHEENRKREYLMCISQACDCKNPDKIHYNFAFVFGEEIELMTAIKNTQKHYYTFINDELVINWSNRFLTIHIPEEKLCFINYAYCYVTETNDDGEMESKELELEFIGHQKEIYTQRVINTVFNHAMRIGIDLPQWTNSE